MSLIKPSFIQILIGVSLTGVTAAILYMILSKDENSEELEEGIKTSRPSTIEVRIPKECVGVVIGRGGSNIKEIQEKSDTKINFKDEKDGDEYRICVIRGTAESAQLAESLIHEFISNQPLIQIAEIWVPQKACGRIIGRNGENIRSISRASNAKITVESTGNNNKSSPSCRVIIKGTAEQIELAKSLIKEKVDEDIEMRKKLETLNSRSPRKKDNVLYLTAGREVEGGEGTTSPSEKLSAVSSDGIVDVFVSAVHSPDLFWLQVVGPRAVELDHLVDQMTEYYNKEENRELHVVTKLSVGQIVAAPFNYDDKWYRAEVVSLKEDEYNPPDSSVEVYYVDYGDSGDLKQSDVLRLRTDFLQLRFQAIESCLAKVVPKDGEWSSESIDAFENLAHVAQWVKLTARIHSYSEAKTRRHREGSPVPCVDLFHTINNQDVSISEELVKQGFAEWKKELTEVNASSDSNNPQTLQDILNNKPESTLRMTHGVATSTPKVTPNVNIDQNSTRSNVTGISTDTGDFILNESCVTELPSTTAESLDPCESSDCKKDNSSCSGGLTRPAMTPSRALLLPDFSDEGSSDELEMC